MRRTSGVRYSRSNACGAIFGCIRCSRPIRLSMLKSGLHWLLAFVSGGWLMKTPHALVRQHSAMGACCVRYCISKVSRAACTRRHLNAVGICATCYSDADSVTFFASKDPIEPWARVYRKGMRAPLTMGHLMASLAIPFLFRPVLLNDAYYGDGAMRQTSPLSPAIHLGANRLLHRRRQRPTAGRQQTQTGAG